MEIVARRVRYMLCVRSFALTFDRHLIVGSIMAQVYVVVAAGSVIAFIIRDLGEPAIAGWVIQVPCSTSSAKQPTDPN
jgi:hypothetical protein